MKNPELAVVLRAGPDGIPLILGRVRNPRLVREAIQDAIATAELRARSEPGADPFGAAAAQQEVRILRGLLAHVCGVAPSSMLM